MTPEQRRLREAHLARRALVRMLRICEVIDNWLDLVEAGDWLELYAHASGRVSGDAAWAGMTMDHRRIWHPDHEPLWQIALTLPGYTRWSTPRGEPLVVQWRTPHLDRITEQARSAILAIHGPEALP